MKRKARGWPQASAAGALRRQGRKDTKYTQAEGWPGERAQQEDSRLQAQEGDLRRNQPCRHLISDFQPSGLQPGEKVNFRSEAAQSAVFCHGSPSKLVQQFHDFCNPICYQNVSCCGAYHNHRVSFPPGTSPPHSPLTLQRPCWRGRGVCIQEGQRFSAGSCFTVIWPRH